MSIEKLLEAIEKKFDSEVVMRYGDKPKQKLQVISTTIPSLDKALGVGGLPKGRIVEIYGPESSGKTTLALTVMAECQRQGGHVAFVDAEHALDPVYAQNIGVDMDNVLLSQPDSGEQALEVVDFLVRSKEIDVIVIDSVAALTPTAEIEGEMGDAIVGKHAKLMAQAMRKLTEPTSKNNVLVLFINQLRDKIGVMYGSPETTTGGKALKFHASVRLDIRRIGAVKNGEENIGNKTRVKVVKNKVSAPHKEAEFDIIYGEGVSRESDIIDTAMDKGIITKKGAWFAYNGNNIAQGREKLRQLLKDPDFYNEIAERVKEENE